MSVAGWATASFATRLAAMPSTCCITVSRKRGSPTATATAASDAQPAKVTTKRVALAIPLATSCAKTRRPPGTSDASATRTCVELDIRASLCLSGHPRLTAGKSSLTGWYEDPHAHVAVLISCQRGRTVGTDHLL